METLETIKEFVEKNPTGHLPLPYRILLRKELKENPTLINKIYFECAKKVFPIWISEYEDGVPVGEILLKANDFLFGNKGEGSKFIELADNNKNYIEMIDSDAGAAGLTSLYLAYSIGTEASFVEDYNGIDDDNKFDYEDILPDYYASIAYSGGLPFNNTGDTEKRREFWNWYIEMVKTLTNSPNKPIIELKIPEQTEIQDEIFIRNQNVDSPSIQENIKQALELTHTLIAGKRKEWINIIVEVVSISGVSYNIYLNNKNDQNKLDLSNDYLSFPIGRVINKIKKEMYDQSPNEGGWLSCDLILEKTAHKLVFNYDKIEQLIIKRKDHETLTAEFKNYPRSKEFTPQWWQKILGKKVKYLE